MVSTSICRRRLVAPGISFAVGACALALTACGGGSGSSTAATSGQNGKSTTVTLGDEATLSGAGAAVGVPQTDGIKLAVQEINASGGVPVQGGRVKFDLKVLDDASKPETAVANIQKLLQSDVHYVVGTLESSGVGAYLPIIKARDDVISMVSGASLPGITKYPPVYRLNTSSAQLDNGAANVILANGAKRVAMLTDKAHAGYVTNTAALVRELQSKGVSVTTQQQYQFGDTQYGAQIEAMLRTKPDVLMMRGYASDLTLAIKTARQLGYSGPIVCNAGFTAKDVSDANAAAAMKDVADANKPTVEYIAKTPKQYPAPVVKSAQQFVQNYRRRYSQDPQLLSGNGYESVYLLAMAIKKAGTATDIAKVRAALDQLTIGDVPNAVIPTGGDRIFDQRQANFALVKNEFANGQWIPRGKLSATLGAR